MANMTENILTYYFGNGGKTNNKPSELNTSELPNKTLANNHECEIELPTCFNYNDDNSAMNRSILIQESPNFDDTSIQHLINNNGIKIAYLSFSSIPSKNNIKKIIDLLINNDNQDILCLVGVYNLANTILEYAGFSLNLFVKFEPKGSKFFIGSDSGMVIISRYPCVVSFIESSDYNLFSDKFCRYGILKASIYLPNRFIPIVLYCTNIQERISYKFYDRFSTILYNTIILCDYSENFAGKVQCGNFKPVELQAGIYSTFPETIYSINSSYGSLTDIIHNIEISY